MRRMAVWFSVLLGSLMGVNAAYGQAAYTASRQARLQFGVGGVWLRNDFSLRASQGVVVWGDYDFSRFLGVAASVQIGSLRAPDHIGERSYELGPKIHVRRGRVELFGRLGVGQGTISNQVYKTASTFNLLSYGGGADYALSRRLHLRLGEVEAQRWLGFEPHGLVPVAVTAGVSYVIP